MWGVRCKVHLIPPERNSHGKRWGGEIYNAPKSTRTELYLVFERSAEHLEFVLSADLFV